MIYFCRVRPEGGFAAIDLLNQAVARDPSFFRRIATGLRP
jgi:hypothetical protein